MKRARLLLPVLAVFCTGTVVADERTFDPDLAKNSAAMNGPADL